MKNLNISKKILKIEMGFALVEALVAGSLVMTSVLALVAYSNFGASLNQKYKIRSNLLETRTALVNRLNNSENWRATVLTAGTPVPGQENVKYNPDLECLVKNTSCSPGSHLLTLMSKNNEVIFDSNNSQLGFTADGTSCSTYGQDISNNKCIFQIKLSWQPVCPKAGACIRPQITTKIEMVSTANTSTLEASGLTTQMNVQMTQFLSTPIVNSAPVVNRFGTYTNSTIYYSVDSPITFQPFATDKANKDTVIESFSPKTTLQGGTLTFIDSKSLKYTPQAGFYGIDTFIYTVRDPVTNKTSVANGSIKVMTPYTWTGLAGNGDIKSSTTKNFCGKVVSGVCDGKTFPGSISYGWPSDVNLVFDNTCTNCNATLDGIKIGSTTYSSPFKASTLEATSLYSGKVNFPGSVTIGGYSGAWLKSMNLKIDSGIFDASSAGSFYVLAMIRNVGYYPPASTDYALHLAKNASFSAPADLRIEGAFYVEDGNSFSHNNGKVSFFGIYNRNSIVYAPNILFYDLDFGTKDAGKKFGTNYGGVWISSDLNVKNNVGIFPTGSVDDKITNGQDPKTWSFVTPAPIVKIYGNLIMDNNLGGGNHCDGAGPNSCLPPIMQLTGDADQIIQGPTSGTPTPSLAKIDLTTPVTAAPSISINKSGGSIAMVGQVGLRGDFLITSVGATPSSYDFTKSKLIFRSDCRTSYFDPGTAIEFQDFYEYMGAGCSARLLLKPNSFNVNGNFYYLGTSNSSLMAGTRDSATVNLKGDLIISGTHDTLGTLPFPMFNFTGNKNARIALADPSAGTTKTFLDWSFSKSGGAKVTLEGPISVLGNIVDLNGDLKAAIGSTLIYPNNYSSGYPSSLNAPKTQFDTIDIQKRVVLAGDAYTNNIKIGPASGTVVDGLSTVSSKLYVSKDMTLNYSAKGYFVGPYNKVVLNGSNDQNITVPTANGSGFDNFIIMTDKTSGQVNMTGQLKLNTLCLKTQGMTLDPSANLSLNSYGTLDASYFTQNGAVFNKGTDIGSGCITMF